MFDVSMGCRIVSYKVFNFSGGEVFVKVDSLLSPAQIYIRGNIESSNDLMELLMLTDALRRAYPGELVNLNVPYFPYARQDRVMEPGQSLSIKVITDLINSQNYNKVTIFDPHSDVTPALLNNVYVLEQKTLAYKIIRENGLKNLMLVAPDAGASKKVNSLASMLCVEVLQAAKIRDMRTGEITETRVYSGHVGDKNLLIVDDICDGGRTFVELAPILKAMTTGEVYLYVTHGIFSKGLDIFEGLIDRIYCPNVFSNVKNHPLLERS